MRIEMRKTHIAYFLLSLFLLISLVNASSYTDHTFGADGNGFIAGGIHLKPNSLHTYIPQYDGNFADIILDDGTLSIAKSLYAYNIRCATDDNITIHLLRWFFSDSTQFTSYAEDESSLAYTINGRNRGEPRAVTGADSWSYDESSTTVSLTVSNNTQVTILWMDAGTSQIEFYLDRIPMFLGIAGMICLVLSPVSLVLKRDDLPLAFTMMLGFFILGIGLLIGWLWG